MMQSKTKQVIAGLEKIDDAHYARAIDSAITELERLNAVIDKQEAIIHSLNTTILQQNQVIEAIGDKKYVNKLKYKRCEEVKK